MRVLDSSPIVRKNSLRNHIPDSYGRQGASFKGVRVQTNAGSAAREEAAQVIAIGLEQRIEKNGRNGILADQRIRKQCLERSLTIAIDRGSNREALLSLHLLGPPQLLP